MKSYYGRAIRQFYKTTTLHGFKYLCSRYFYDRVCWVACCFASACCASVLCAVLWARFLQVPALLTLHDQRAHTAKMRLPLVAVCPNAETVATHLQQRISADLNKTKRLPTVLKHVLKRKLPSQEQLEILDDILSENDLTLQEALMLVLPACKKMVVNCRWQSKITPCEKLFEKELTEWGACCVMRPENVKLNMVRRSYFEETNKLDIAVQCTHHPNQNGCQLLLDTGMIVFLATVITLYEGEISRLSLSKGRCAIFIAGYYTTVTKSNTDIIMIYIFSVYIMSPSYFIKSIFYLYILYFFTRYNGEDWVEPILLTPGYNYLAQISFTSVEDKDSDKLVDGKCINKKEYTRRECLLKCREQFCGCADPMQRQKHLVKVLPTCQILKLKCLRTSITNENNTCLPSCKKITTYLSLESSLMNAVNESNDQIYTGLNTTTSSVLRITVLISASRIFVVNPTETWLTLLSSLGGIFNMFLGVGLFSALEGLFLVFVRLPIAIRKSTEMDNVSNVGH